MSHIMQHNTLDNFSNSQKYVKSLNRAYRKRELTKITAENQAILRRIQSSAPTYNHWEGEEKRRKNEGYLRNICEYKAPGGGGRPNTSGRRARPRTAMAEYGERTVESSKEVMDASGYGDLPP